MGDANEQATDAEKYRPVERGGAFQHLFADTAVVEPIHDMVSISFLLESIRTTSVVWEAKEDRPDRVGRSRVFEELASVRMSRDAANALALDILVELGAFVTSTDVLEKNFAIVRASVEERLNSGGAEEVGD
ncbi:hypothetical protein [Sphingomonas sp. VNH70]|uniref:hypothetical protein n=1 Tax=Sphingomonas silueang TaxID=3156617 RepID=UPI0032B55B87